MTKITAARRKKSATVHVKGSDGKTKEKFPIDSVQTAESAVKLRNNAKPPLTSEQKAHVLAEAAKYGVKPASAKPSAKKKAAKK